MAVKDRCLEVVWILKKLKLLIISAVAALFGISVIQIEPFTEQYLENLSIKLEEETSNLELILNSSEYQNMEENARNALEIAAISEVNKLQKSYEDIEETTPIIRPILLLTHWQPELISVTYSGFLPVIRLTTWNAIKMIISMAIIISIPDAINILVKLITRQHRTRKFRSRGNID